MRFVSRVQPFFANIARSIIKEPKIYFFDMGMVEGDEGVRFENLVAVSLLKHAYGIVDYLGRPYSLNYLRTKEGAEVDFCLVNNDKPELMIEAKRSDSMPGRSILYFNKKYGIPGVQVALHLKKEKIEKGIEIRNAADYLQSLAY
jgi:predicted AAA+ superfamily ATPase